MQYFNRQNTCIIDACILYIDGASIKTKIDSTLKELKKCLGHWNEFAPRGCFPSGKNEDDALKYVIEMMKVHKGEDDDDDDDVDGAEEKEDDDDEPITMQPYIPAFMLFGPYGVRKWNLELCELVSIDTAAIDAKNKKKRNRDEEEAKQTIIDLTHSDRIRGITSDRQRLLIEIEQTRLACENQVRVGHQQQFDVAQSMFDRFEKLNDVGAMREQMQIMKELQMEMRKPIPTSALLSNILLPAFPQQQNPNQVPTALVEQTPVIDTSSSSSTSATSYAKRPRLDPLIL
jgi:hypothetical protein